MQYTDAPLAEARWLNLIFNTMTITQTKSDIEYLNDIVDSLAITLLSSKKLKKKNCKQQEMSLHEGKPRIINLHLVSV